VASAEGGQARVLHVGDDREYDRERGKNQEGDIENSPSWHGGIIRQVGHADRASAVRALDRDAPVLNSLRVVLLLSALLGGWVLMRRTARRVQAQQQAAEATGEGRLGCSRTASCDTTWTITQVADYGPGIVGFAPALPAAVAMSTALRSHSRLRVHDRRYRER
jgi:hypothetical protein